ncbi:MAG: DUF4230 domain-containing protein [Acidimicrobiia bacterium]
MPVLAPDRHATPDAVEGSPPARPVRPRRGWRRARLAALVAVLVLVGLGLDRLTGLFPSLSNPFRTEQVERTGPAVLTALADLHEFRAATGTFQVFIDLEDDTRYVPAFLKGERTLFLATGTVDAAVDFSSLGLEAVTVSEDRRSVSVRLPAAHLSDPKVDPAQSRVVDRDRGLLDRLGSVFTDSPTGERPLYLAAQPRLSAAAAEAGLAARAEENTAAMLRQLLGALGFEDIDVTFAAPSL